MRLLVLLAVCVTASTACSCLPYQSLKEVFCSSDFVSHVKVLSKKDPNVYSHGFEDVIYTVRHIHVYRKPKKYKKLSKNIKTAPNSAACGIDLEIGKEYLLGGSVDDKGELQSYLCGLVRRWKDVSAEDKAALKTYICYA
ncbi:tissue inhibitor of metalloproteinase [Oesophagostomum dentatum]|uniref:Tissue inhibitor of metalloproteinase n=1 Tax=Oesophagostomum dentatum TaxID=61180 RepID=A0A0B1T1Z6_OESDE|nr:tissue inhibitor of metalloproteinase [Oesophagostomum dentatum]